MKCKLHAVFRTRGWRMKVVGALSLCKHLISRNGFLREWWSAGICSYADMEHLLIDIARRDFGKDFSMIDFTDAFPCPWDEGK